LNEIEEKKGGCEPSEEIVITLLNRIKDFNEWGQSTILDLVARFEPDNEDLKFDIMNLLEDRLKHASSSVLLGAVKVFINLTKDDKNLSRDVHERLAGPLITTMASAGTTENYEI
jgi:AP-4 complex subunit beta-1